MILNLFPTLVAHERFDLGQQPEFGEDWKMRWRLGQLIPGLKNFVDQQVNQYFETCGFRGFDLAEFSVWVNQLESPSRHIVPHNHGSAIVGWVYYINVQEDSGDIVFLNPKGNNSWDYFYRPEHPNRSPNHDFLYKFKPKNGDLLIFPGWLSHYVEPNTSDCTRISIAGEYHVKGFEANLGLIHHT